MVEFYLKPLTLPKSIYNMVEKSNDKIIKIVNENIERLNSAPRRGALQGNR
jgi:hypothetical protein